MEIFSPVAFVHSLLRAPLNGDNYNTPVRFSLRDPRAFLAIIYLIHYSNRALISPLRTPSRSKMHAIVALAAVFFNVINGTLLGSYLSSPACESYLISGLTNAYARPRFWLGIGVWAMGFIGNIIHDEVLLNLRRNAKRADDGKEHYSIPYGYLYKYISYPNYLCEWIEWAGYALAAAPLPALSLAGLSSAAPPWLFVFNEIFLMAPRAYKGHMWYHSKFPNYPKERSAVIPFIL